MLIVTRMRRVHSKVAKRRRACTIKPCLILPAGCGSAAWPELPAPRSGIGSGIVCVKLEFSAGLRVDILD